MSKSRINPVVVGQVPAGVDPALFGKIAAALGITAPAIPAATAALTVVPPVSAMPRVQSDAPAKPRRDGKVGPSPIQIVAVLGRVENRAAVEYRHTDPSHPYYTAKRCFGLLPSDADLSKITVGSAWAFPYGTESYSEDKLRRAAALDDLAFPAK